jgi:hypothetical protein
VLWARRPTLAVFVDRYETLIRKCADDLADAGKFAVLMADHSERSLWDYTKEIAFRA